PGEGRRRQLVVAVDPLRVLRRQHVRLDPELGEVRGELQRALDAAAAGGREVERDEQHLHERRGIRRPPRTAHVAPYLRGIAGSPFATQRLTSSRRAYGSLAFVFATCSGGAATM